MTATENELPDPDHPLFGAALKVKRAKSHILDINRAITDFLHSDPYLVVPGDYNEERQCHTRVVTRAVPVPPEIGVLIGDAIHNLRSAFDLVACECVELGGGDRSKASFPVYRKPETGKADPTKKIKGAPDVAVEVTRSLQPYQGTQNEVLWHLHQLDILDKHRMIVPVGTAIARITARVVGNRSFGVGFIAGDAILEGTMTFAPDARVADLKEGTVILLPKSPRETDYDAQLTFGVAFGKGQVVEGEAVVSTLNKFAQFTEDALKLFRDRVFHD